MSEYGVPNAGPSTLSHSVPIRTLEQGTCRFQAITSYSSQMQLYRPEYGSGGGQLNSCHDGTISRPLSIEENTYRAMILDFSMLADGVNSTLNRIQADVPSYTHLDFTKCIAALCKRYERKVVRRQHASIRKFMNSFGQPARQIESNG